ncbi:MAG: GGDEF domain-containing protein [Blautia marasmi]
MKRRLKNMERTSSCMMIMLDVDGFKMLNDTYGHPFGDNILLQVACALQSTFRKNDICARIGGDEFMGVLEGEGQRRLSEKAAAACYLYAAG